MDELKAMIRSLAISSASGMTLSQLDRDFKSLEGCHIPYQNHGFNSLLSMLRTLTDVVEVKGNDEHSSTIHPVTTEKNHHIRSMVEKSKKSKKKKVTVHRRPTYWSSESTKSKPSSYAKQQYHGKSSNTTQRYSSKSSTGTQQHNSNSGTYAHRNTGRTRGRNVTSQNDYFHHDKHFDIFIKELNAMLAAQQYGQYNWYGTNVNNGTPYNFYYPSSDMSSYWNNQQYYQNGTQQSGWNYNNAGWNCNQGAGSKKKYNTNNYPANDWIWNGFYPQHWAGYNNMYNNNSMGYNNMYNNSMGYNNNAGGYNSNQWNCGMGNYMNYGYSNNYSSNACNNGYSYYDLAAWYNAYGQYYS